MSEGAWCRALVTLRARVARDGRECDRPRRPDRFKSSHDRSARSRAGFYRVGTRSCGGVAELAPRACSIQLLRRQVDRLTARSCWRGWLPRTADRGCAPRTTTSLDSFC